MPEAKAKAASRKRSVASRKRFEGESATRAAGQRATQQAQWGEQKDAKARQQGNYQPKGKEARIMGSGMQKPNPNYSPEVKRARRIAEMNVAGKDLRTTMNMQKAAYQFIHKWSIGAIGKPKAPGNATPENPGQQIAEAKKKDESGGQKAPVQQTPSYGGKKSSWIGDLVRAGQDIAGVRHGQQKEIPTMNMKKQEAEWKTPQIEREMQKDVKSLAGGSGWKQHKQGVPRASQRKMRQGWDQSAGIGGSNQTIGYTGMSEG